METGFIFINYKDRFIAPGPVRNNAKARAQELDRQGN
jgi:hypothetical protein